MTNTINCTKKICFAKVEHSNVEVELDVRINEEYTDKMPYIKNSDHITMIVKGNVDVCKLVTILSISNIVFRMHPYSDTEFIIHIQRWDRQTKEFMKNIKSEDTSFNINEVIPYNPMRD